MFNGAERLRRELMIHLVRQFNAGTLDQEIDRIPVAIRPREVTPSRCCVYHDRAVIKYRLMGLMGVACESETDESKPLSAYLREAKEPSYSRPERPLTVCAAACDSCRPSRINITDNCRGCFARPCTYTCPVKAITVVNQKSVVDQDKCIKCGKCTQVCPFNAIIKTKVPCEEACPVGAIRKNARGVAEIDFDKCIFCGKCFSKCPFSAIMERSELLKILQDLASNQPVVALVAPAAEFQFPGGIEKLFTAIKKAGFKQVVEVAIGAELTTAHESEEFIERMQKGDRLMTSSCCPAYVEMVKRHVPALLKCVSTTPSPMLYAADFARRKYPDAKLVFIGPCVAKRHEALKCDKIAHVMTFEELGAVFAGLGIDVMSQEPSTLPRPAVATARNFAKSCGVTDAVLKEFSASNAGIQVDHKFINGLDSKSKALLTLYAVGKMPANFLEVMACHGGCVGGPCSLVNP